MSVSKAHKVSRALEPFVHQHPTRIYGSPASNRLLQKESWTEGVKGRMPKHYKEFYLQWRKGPQEHIHSRPNLKRFERDEWGEIHPVQNPRIYVVYPKEFHEGLWGGEGVIKGLMAREETRHRSFLHPPARYWWPRLLEGVVYSEVLDKHIDMVMTHRGVKLVDEANGFDNYILNTPVNEVYAFKLLKLKREILLKLADKDNFAGGKTAVFDKYHEHAVSFEQADWTGLTLEEAKRKQLVLDSIKRKEEEVPLKTQYRDELVHLLKEGFLDDLDPDLQVDESTKPGLLSGIKNVFKK